MQESAAPIATNSQSDSSPRRFQKPTIVSIQQIVKTTRGIFRVNPGLLSQWITPGAARLAREYDPDHAGRKVTARCRGHGQPQRVTTRRQLAGIRVEFAEQPIRH